MSHVHQIREIGANVLQLAGDKAANEVMNGSDKIRANTKPDAIAVWVQGAMERLDKLVDEPTRTQVMLNCGYNCGRANHTAIERALKRRGKFKSEEEFLTAEVCKPPVGTRLERDGNTLRQFYTPQSFTRPMRCYCSLLRGLPADETVSKTYCQCSRGFVQKYWEGILGRPAQVELIASCVSGASECEFVIHL